LNGEIAVLEFAPEVSGQDLVYFDEEFEGLSRCSVYHRNGGLYYVAEYTKDRVISERLKDKSGKWRDVPRINTWMHGIHELN
jgi:hypothetical protein